ncbi:hypothetical protein PQX77_007788 [Marasmius sp. AFHP31]|nr:hypothetical protein PQX77_011781 [Marasmius sp. AFHP31]KAK1229216.1 hypothetical protein PQX77_007788 [Marasmius sp. AFHP31]
MAAIRSSRRHPATDSQNVLTTKTNSISASTGDRAKDKSPTKPSVVFSDVIEISSDEDEPPAPLSHKRKLPPSDTATVSQLERELKKLKEDNARLARENTQLAQKQNQSECELELYRKERGTGRLDISDLEDHISCEICTLKLWAPCILPDCGHVFCQSCLQDWFSTTLAQHMTTYPHYNVNQRLPRFIEEATNLYPQHAAELLQRYAGLIPPKPGYTCPTCRASVKSRPIEDYSLKAVVRTVAKAAREDSPKQPRPQINRGRRRGGPVNDGPWDGFFPKT